LSDMHNVFHVSQLKKCMSVPEEQIPMEDLSASEVLSYQEYLVKIQQMCKVQWSHHNKEEATWE
jgi:hypothetical protein